jgi:hypothetical protein
LDELVSTHFTGLSLGPPLGDQRGSLRPLRLPLTGGPEPNGVDPQGQPERRRATPRRGLPDHIDNDGDLRDDIAFSFVYSEPKDGRQTVDVYLDHDQEAESDQAVGSRIFEDVEVSFGKSPNIVTAGSFTFFAGARSDGFFFDFDGIKHLFDTSGGRNFTAPHLGSTSPWTGVDYNAEANVFSMVLELPTSALGADPDIRIWGRCSVRRDGEQLHVDRAGHPSVSSFFNTDDTKAEHNAGELIRDRERWIGMFIHLMGHTGGTAARKPSRRSNRRARCPTCSPTTRPSPRSTPTAAGSPTT